MIIVTILFFSLLNRNWSFPAGKWISPFLLFWRLECEEFGSSHSVLVLHYFVVGHIAQLHKMASAKQHPSNPTMENMTKKNKKIKYKRAPLAPKRFKSAYMFYSAEQHRMIRDNAVDKKVRRETLRSTAHAISLQPCLTNMWFYS